MENKNACSGKIMLFGEYSIMEGSSAALIPYQKVKAYFKSPFNSNNHKAARSNALLVKFMEYLKELNDSGKLNGIFDFSKLASELDSGLYLESSIPENYGLGSSGALCVAVYRNFHHQGHDSKALSVAERRTIFAIMESYFHGTSSGVDPLCIYTGEPLAIINDEYIWPGVDGLFTQNVVKPFLINTGIKSSTAVYVNEFQANMKNGEFKKDFTRHYVKVTDEAVMQWVQGKLEENTIFALSRMQQHFFRNMIAHNFQDVWDKGIYTGMYALKLCGSGGGGMIIGFTDDLAETKDYLMKNYNICIEPVAIT